MSARRWKPGRKQREKDARARARQVLLRRWVFDNADARDHIARALAGDVTFSITKGLGAKRVNTWHPLRRRRSV